VNSLSVENIDGSAKIARAVYSNDRAFGIVQEEILFEQDLLDGEVQIVAPLYNEHVHILYNKTAFNSALIELAKRDPEYDKPSESIPEIGISTSNGVQEFFSKSNVRLRSSPQKTLPLGHYLLDFSSVSPKTLYDMGIEKTLISLTESGPNSLQVAIVVAGAPLKGIYDVLADPNNDIGLMAIDPGLISEINPTLNMALRPSVLSGQYGEGTGSVATLASRAMLIASADVPSWIIRDIGAILEKMRIKAENYKQDVNLELAHHEGVSNLRYLFPESDYSFGVRIRKEYASEKKQMIQILLIAILATMLLTCLFYFLLVWAISTYKHAHHSREITKIGRAHV